MGRTAVDDPVFFLAAGAAGVLAARMAAGSRAWRAHIAGERRMPGPFREVTAGFRRRPEPAAGST